MAVTSQMLPLGTRAPDFTLRDLHGETVSLGDFADAPVLLVMFLCNHCPYVRHVEQELGQLTAQYQDKSVAVVGMCSNDPEAYPDDAPEGLRTQVDRAGFTFPYLIDETQEVAKGYAAACTPDFYVFDADRRLAYRGQMDASRPKDKSDAPVDGRDLRAALDAVLAGQAPSDEQYPSMGCNIKWKPGNAPAYAA